MARNTYDEDAYTREEFSHFQNILLNGTARIPICFCIDVSKSMDWLTNPSSDLIVTRSGYEDGGSVNHVKLRPGATRKSKLDDLKKVLRKLIYGLRDEAALRDSAVVSIVTFSRYANTVVNFCEPVSLDGNVIANQIKLGVDVTNVSEGINLALNKLSTMSKVLSDAQTESYKPVFILISDGLPTDGREAEEAVSRLRSQAANDELSIIPIGIYMDIPGKQWLRQLRPDGEIFTMNSDYDFEQVFDMIEQLIVEKAPIISVDEEIMSDNQFAKETEIPATAYGQTASPDDLLKLFEFPEDV